MIEKMIYRTIFYLTFGCMVSIIQQGVLNGFPIKLNNFFWEEWIGSSIYLFVYIQMQLKILRTFISEFKKQEKLLNIVVKYFVILQLLGFTVFIIFSILFTIILNGSFFIRLKDILQLRFIFIYFFFIHSLIYIAGVAIRLYKMYSSEKDAKHLAEKSFLSAQLQMLRQQLNPHFLFNNLNIIASTIQSNPTLASDFTKSMALFYRKVLESDNENWVLVKNEIKTIQSYLHLLSIRFEDKLQFTIEVSIDIQNNYVVPDFILQPIVENVVKHNSCSKASPLQIVITANNDTSLIIKNNYQPKNNKQESIGIGWFNIESRYKFLGAKIPVKYVKDGWFCVEVFLIKN